MGLRGEGEAADKTDVPGDDRGQKKRLGLPRGVRPLQKILDVARRVDDGGDGGGKAKRSSPPWVLVWGESARGHIEVPSHLPPLGTWVSRRTEVGGGRDAGGSSRRA